MSGVAVGFKCSAAIPRLYRVKFGRDVFKDFMALQASFQQKEEDGKELQIGDLELFENIAYIMAYHADNSITDSVDEWLEQFDMFSIYEILPELIDLWGRNMSSTAQSAKNLEAPLGK